MLKVLLIKRQGLIALNDVRSKDPKKKRAFDLALETWLQKQRRASQALKTIFPQTRQARRQTIIKWPIFTLRTH